MNTQIAISILAALMLALLGCGQAEDSERRESVPLTYDQTCQTHDDCVAVEPCVCGCPEDSCGSGVAINRSELAEFSQAKSAIQCLTPERQALSCDAGVPVCVAGRCEVESVRSAEAPPVSPDDADRTCERSGDCAIVNATQCELESFCGTEFTAVNEDAVQGVNAWRLECDQYVERTCDIENYQRQKPLCDSGTCVAIEAPLEPADDVDCESITDPKACLQAGCGVWELNAWTLDESDACARTTAFACSGPGLQLDFANSIGPAHVRDDVALLLPTAQPWGFAQCNGEPVCDCVPRP